jgi:alkylation response protein AidB-like acyl-CoA dehydrogenase
MDFGISEDQVLLKDSVRKFLEAECPTTRVRDIMESDTGHDAALWQGLADLGLTALPIAEDFGGAGLEVLDLALIAEEFGFACTPGPFLGNALGTIALQAAENSEAKSRWLPKIAAGKAVATYAAGEKIGVWEAEDFEVRSSGGKLYGEKPLVPFAAIADIVIVAALDSQTHTPDLFLVERGADGMMTKELIGNDMTRRVSTVHFDGTEALALGGGKAAIDRVRDTALVLLAADAYGGATRCMEMTRDYVMIREQFGQTIAHFQGIKHQLADLATDLTPTCSLWWYAAHAIDHIEDRSAHTAALAKARITDLFDEMGRKGIELHGGIGFTWEHDIHLWVRRSLFDRAFFGEASYHRARAADLRGW